MLNEFSGGVVSLVAVQEGDSDPAQQIAALKRAGHRIFPYTYPVLQAAAERDQPLSAGVYTLRLLTADELMDQESITYAELSELGLSAGFQLCPAALAIPHIIQHSGGWGDDVVMVAMETVMTTRENYLWSTSDGNGRLLDLGISHPLFWRLPNFVKIVFLEARP